MGDRDYTLVMSGGGLKGLAHAGVLLALEEASWLPREVVGSSIGALVSAAWCAGWRASELRDLALQITRRDLFRVAHSDMALKRMRSPALYRSAPLREFIQGLLDEVTFAELDRPLVVNTVDLRTGSQRLWSASTAGDVLVADAVYASCALPGFLPPLEIDGHVYGDGASVGNLPIGAALEFGRSLVVAVDVGSPVPEVRDLVAGGFAAVYARAIEIAIGRMRDTDLQHWSGPPLLLLQPAVSRFSMFTFNHNAELVEAGYRVARQALAAEPPAHDASGVFRVRVAPDEPATRAVA